MTGRFAPLAPARALAVAAVIAVSVTATAAAVEKTVPASRAETELSYAPLVVKLFDTLAARYAERAGGYTRVVKAGHRYGDAAAMAVIELVDRDPAAKGQDSGPVPTTEEEPREAVAG